MKRIPFLFVLFFMITHSLHADTKMLPIKKVADGFYLMYYDTSAIKKTVSKSVIIAFKDYIVLLEMPIAYSNSNLTDHTAEGENVMKTLKAYFPGKPLKYVISSHWHPHSISSVIPFISSGVTLITTTNNFHKLRAFVDSDTYTKYHDHILFMDDDSMVIKDKSNSIVIYKCMQSDYSFIPTDDFLLCYMPKYQTLQTSCMYQRLKGSKVRGKEMVSGRAENLYQFTRSKRLPVKGYLCTEVNDDNEDGLIPDDTLQMIISNGLGMKQLEDELLRIPSATYAVKNDSLLKVLVTNPIPMSIINRAVYTCLKGKDLDKALALAKIQALLNPSDPNAWDTYGEVFYFMGETKMANRYEAQSTRIDKTFAERGEKIWQSDLEDYQKIWNKQ